MRNLINKKIIFGILIGIILTSSTVYAINYVAKDILFEPSNDNWNVDNVEDALNDLYLNSDTVLWKNDNVSVEFPAQTIELDLDRYSSILIISAYSSTYTDSKYNSYIIIKKGETGVLSNMYDNSSNDYTYRNITVTSNSVEFSGGYNGASTSSNINAKRCIPTYIIGIK